MDLKHVKVEICKLLGINADQARKVKIEFGHTGPIEINVDSILLEGTEVDVTSLASNGSEFEYEVREKS